MTDLAQFARLAHGPHDRASALDRIGHHLFAINMQAGLQAEIRVRRMPEIRSRDDNRIEAFFLRQHVFNISVGGDLKAGFAQTVLSVSAAEGPDIADGAEI